ncbi:uncharacterized protein LOC110863384 isoform X2 [Folsomia candida]|uniref:uncharacterized protein LOC110863384 isoform X2 n=1 Tax=Folsomia candida TaxID=158441 RepID=UPI001604AF2D|nr:uncharacterized protein LOC110863384 isoform X2 [Folsomia candida]
MFDLYIFSNVTSASEVYGPMMQRISMFVLLFIGAFLSPVQSGDSGAGGRQVASSSSAVDFLDRGPAGPSGREEDAGLYGPAPPLPLIAGTRGGNGATTLADHLKGANYPPESAIDQFEVGYGGTYYRKDGDRSGPERNVRPNNNHIGYGPSGSSFDKPLDSFRETGSNPLNLNGLSVAELEQLRNLAEAAQGIGNAARQGGGGGGNGGVGSLNAGNGNAGGPNVVANHGTLGPLLPKDSQDDKGLTYGSGGGASSSYKPLLEYGPGGGPGVLQGVLDAQIKLNALRSQLLAHNLAKLDHHAAKVHAGAYGPPPGHHYGPGPLDHHHHKSALLNLHPLFGKLDAVDAHLLGKLQAKDIELANLEREKLQLIAAAGKAALGSIREKEKLVHLYGQLGIADALNNPLGKHHPPGPGFGYHPAAGAEKAAALADKAALLADKAAAHADKAADIANHHANHAAGHEYNPNFGPLPADKIHLNPIKPLGYGAPLAPPLGNYGGAFGGGLLSPAAREEQLKGQHYYGPAPGPNYAAYNGHAVGKGALFGEHGLAPHQRPGPYPSVDDVVHRHNGGYGVPPAAHLHGKLDVLVENVAKNTAKALVGALQGYGYGNKHNHYNNHH